MIKQNNLGKKMTAVMMSAVLAAGLLAGCSGKDVKRTESKGSNTKAQSESTLENSSESTPEGTSDDILKEDQYKYQKSLDKFTAKLEHQMKYDGIPGASVSVTENGETIYSKGFGYANQEKKIPTDENTLFYTGSVGKVYATAAMLKLVQEQGLSLDDPVIKHLPEFQVDDERYKDITLRMLLNHSAGLPSDVNATAMAAGSTMPEEIGLDLLEELRSQTLRSNPGEYAVYSNIGFELAQRMIEKISGQTFGIYMKENFFDPLKLKNTYMVSDENKEVADERFALPINEKGKTLPREYASRSTNATGGIVSTTEDTCIFIDGVLSPETGILSKESIAQLGTDQSLSANFPEQQELNGLGWDEISRTITQTPVYEKSGASTHCSTKTITAPEAGITITASMTQFHNIFIYDELKNLMHDILLEKGTITAQTDAPVYPEEAATGETDSIYSGIYTGGDGLHDLASLHKADIVDNTMQHSRWDGAQWQNVGEYTHRDDGSYGCYDEETKVYISYSFQLVGADVYLMKRVLTPEYDTTTAMAKRIPEKTAVESWEKYNNNLWLRTNIWPSDYQAEACFSFLQTMQDLPGYVAVNGGAPIMDIKDDTHLSSINNLSGGSGYADLTFTDDRFSWIGMDFISADEAMELPRESTTISFEKANTVQWYYVTEDAKIDIDVPYNQVRVLNLSPELSFAYDNLSGNEVFTAKAGSYIGLTSATSTEIDMGITAVK